MSSWFLSLCQACLTSFASLVWFQGGHFSCPYYLSGPRTLSSTIAHRHKANESNIAIIAIIGAHLLLVRDELSVPSFGGNSSFDSPPQWADSLAAPEFQRPVNLFSPQRRIIQSLGDLSKPINAIRITFVDHDPIFEVDREGVTLSIAPIPSSSSITGKPLLTALCR